MQDTTTKEVYYDTDSAYLMKQHLNSMYGKVVTDMSKDYIVAHESIADETPAVVIIFKSHICKVRRHGDGTADIFLDGGQICYACDRYEDIIKQLV